MTTSKTLKSLLPIKTTLLNQKVLRMQAANRAKQERSIKTCMDLANLFMTLVKRDGIGEINIRAIGIEGRVTRTNLYRYFEGYEELITFVARVIVLSNHKQLTPEQTSVVLMAEALLCKKKGGKTDPETINALCPRVMALTETAVMSGEQMPEAANDEPCEGVAE